MAQIIPAIKYEACREAIHWLSEVFGFDVHFLVEAQGDAIAHAQLVLGNDMIMVGSVDDSEFGRMNVPPSRVDGRNTASLYVCIADVSEHYAKVVGAGADIVQALRREDHGGESYTCRDLEGHLWTFGSYDPWSSQ